jgi:hypothetical protein
MFEIGSLLTQIISPPIYALPNEKDLAAKR